MMISFEKKTDVSQISSNGQAFAKRLETVQKITLYQRVARFNKLDVEKRSIKVMN